MSTEPVTRDLHWAGGANVRDLGGLPLIGGGETRRGRILRSASIDDLSADGWASVADAGVDVVLDLRGAHERIDTPLRPMGLTTVTVPLEDPSDPFYAEWDGRLASMDYFLAGMTHWASLWEEAAEKIADLPAGTALVHCAAGRDRTGVVSALTLRAAGVEREAIVGDYLAGVHGAPRPNDQRDSILPDARAGVARLLDAPLSPALEDAFGALSRRLL